MAELCTICTSPRREEIDVSIANVGTRKTATAFKLTPSTVHRHKKHATSKTLAIARSPQDVITRLDQVLSDALRRRPTVQKEIHDCLTTLSKLIQQNTAEHQQERNLEAEIAKLVGQATGGWNVEEFYRLRALDLARYDARNDENRTVPQGSLEPLSAAQ